MLTATVLLLHVELDNILAAIRLVRRQDPPIGAFLSARMQAVTALVPPVAIAERMMSFLLCSDVTNWSLASSLTGVACRSPLLLFQLRFGVQTLPRLGELVAQATHMLSRLKRKERGVDHFALELLRVYFVDPSTHERGRFRMWHQYRGGFSTVPGWAYSRVQLQVMVEEAIGMAGAAWYDPEWVHHTLESHVP